MANTFQYAQGYDVGGSLCEKDMADTAREILNKAEQSGCRIILPADVVVAEDLKPGVATETLKLTKDRPLGDGKKIFDAGPETLAEILAAMRQAKTLIWNGPLGVFEVQPFDKATVEAAQEAARLATSGQLVAVAGGGDTVAALNAAGVADDFTFVSTAGGAFLEWMEGKELPGVAALAR
jgi:phosphoglycerate kinase